MKTEQRISTRSSFGAKLPFSADCTDFMYQWKSHDQTTKIQNNIKERKSVWDWTMNLQKNVMDEYVGWHAQYNENKIGSLSLSFVHASVDKFTSFIHQRVVENEGARFSFLNTIFG